MKKRSILALLTVISIFAVFSVNAAEGTLTTAWNVQHDDSIKTHYQKAFDSDFYTKETFAATFKGASNVTDEIVDQAWAYYLNQNWVKLNELFTTHNIASGGIIWPPANGGFNTRDSVFFKKGQRFDRYGSTIGAYTSGVPNLGGSFTSPIIDGRSFTFAQRALNGPENSYDLYYTIEILQDLEFFCREADIIPWFNQPGMGIQENWVLPKDPNSPQGYSYTFTQLAQMGFIRIVIVSSPSGKYPQLVGTVIEKTPIKEPVEKPKDKKKNK